MGTEFEALNVSGGSVCPPNDPAVIKRLKHTGLEFRYRGCVDLSCYTLAVSKLPLYTKIQPENDLYSSR